MGLARIQMQLSIYKNGQNQTGIRPYNLRKLTLSERVSWLETSRNILIFFQKLQPRRKRGGCSIPTFEQSTLFFSIFWQNLTYSNLQPLHFYHSSAGPVDSMFARIRFFFVFQSIKRQINVEKTLYASWDLTMGYFPLAYQISIHYPCHKFR